MADIVNPEVLRFVTEVVRPYAEKMRALKATIDSAITTWWTINALCPNDSSPVEDGRESEGVSRLVGSDVVGLITQMLVYKAAMEQSGVPGVISKPCVRPLEA